MNWIKLVVFGGLVAFASAASADWVYRKHADQMTGGETSLALLESNNSLSLEFPYSGRNYGTVVVRRHPRLGTSVMIEVEKGQILCRESECGVLVRFDDQSPITMRGGPSSDHDSRVVFLLDHELFIKRARSAKSILVQLGMYQAGNQVLRFHSSKPLEWAAVSAPAARQSVDAEALAAANMCFACHKQDEKLVGPSFDSIKARYAGRANAESILVASLTRGSAGKWGKVAMPANPGLTVDDARHLAKWVLGRN